MNSPRACISRKPQASTPSASPAYQNPFASTIRSRSSCGRGTRSKKSRSWLFSGRSWRFTSASAPTSVMISVTEASITSSPSARATETRWCPSRTKCSAPIR